MKLTELPLRTGAIVETVEELVDGEAAGAQGRRMHDGIARRLRELGFVAGERVEVVATGPFGGEPLLVQIGFTRFALRRSEAARVRLRNGSAADAGVARGEGA